jgi:hypothetical protein
MTSPPAAAERTTIPEATVPVGWESVLAKWPAVGPSGLVDAVHLARDSGQLSVLSRSDGEYGDFATWLRAGLAGVTRSVAVTFPEARHTPAVVSLLGALLGKVDYPAGRTLGGPASAVPTGGVDRYEQAWHTDGTPWAVPNRWTILGLLHGDPALPQAATSVLPWAEIEEAWQDDPDLLDALRRHEFPWRNQYPHLPPLSAPIRGAVARWFRPALAGFIDDPTRRVAACHAVDMALKGATRWYEAVVVPTRVLIFDNYAALHRGPAVKELSSRTLLRLKVSGSPEP